MNKIEKLFLKYIIGYKNPKRYWNWRWKFRNPASQPFWNKLHKTISTIMKKQNCHNILEIGCGEAKLRSLPNYKGLDFSEEIMRRNKLKTFIIADITKKIPLKDKSYDASFIIDVLLHIPTDRIEQAVKEICRVTKKCIIITEVPITQQSSQPHCFEHNLPKLFKDFNGEMIFLEP